MPPKAMRKLNELIDISTIFETQRLDFFLETCSEMYKILPTLNGFGFVSDVFSSVSHQDEESLEGTSWATSVLEGNSEHPTESKQAGSLVNCESWKLMELMGLTS